jgi:hypothetical protein
MSVLIPLYAVNFHRYPVDEARSSKDFISNFVVFKGSILPESHCAHPQRPGFTKG